MNRNDDRGFTLIELVVVMVVMAIFMAIFGKVMVLIFDTSSREQASARTAQDLEDAFAGLERQVRYVSYISTPAQDVHDGNWYVEMQDTTQTPALCTQLRLNVATAQLQSRSWQDGTVTPGGWTLIADKVSGSQPFVRTGATGAVRAAQLTVQLLASRSSGQGTARSQLSVTLAALNTTTAPVGGHCSGFRP